MENPSVVYGQHGDWWLACVQELPDANTQARTLDEAADELWRLIPAVAGDRPVAAERLGHREFGVPRIAPTL